MDKNGEIIKVVVKEFERIIVDMIKKLKGKNKIQEIEHIKIKSWNF